MEAAGIPEEETRRQQEPYADLVGRLSRQSVTKHFDAYADVPWDDPTCRIDHEDPRFALGPTDPLGATAWYRSLPQSVRARLGLHMIATFAKVGSQFENVLQRGLLDFAMRLPNGAPEFRYAYHEVIEEGQHSLMFQELVNRTGFDIPGLSTLDRLGARQVVRLARVFPELFFFFVLGGEDPIDHAQRRTLREGGDLHPLLKRIMQIHVTEEARHLCFARSFLREHVPRLSPLRRAVLRVRVPLLLGPMARMMTRPSRAIARTYAIPREVLDEAYRRNPIHRARTVEALGKIRALCEDLRLVTRRSARLWALAGIWDGRVPA